jgi:hypothetical protein
MDESQDLILGVLSGKQYVFKYPGLEAYLVSLKNCGFKGRKVMLVWNINPVAREALIKHGFELVDIDPYPTDMFFHARMRLAWEYMRDHSREFRYVFWFDIKDFVFQTNPSVWMEKNIGNAKVIASTECVTIEQEETNQLWAKSILGEDKYQEVKDEEVINGGTWAGESETVAEVFHQVHKGCISYTGTFPPCQIWLNYVLRQNPFKSVLRIPRWSESFSACLHPVWWNGARVKCQPFLKDYPPLIDTQTSLLYPGNAEYIPKEMVLFNRRWGRTEEFKVLPMTTPLEGVGCISKPCVEPFVVVHGYDRDWNMKEMFEFRYRFSGGFNLKDFIESNQERFRLSNTRTFRRPDAKVFNSRSVVPREARVFKRNS